MSTLFTVIITTKNRPDYLRDAINSVVQQDKSHAVNIIIVDDGSDVPGDQQIAEAQRASCLILRNEKSVGVSAARNQGAQAAETQWLIFLDDDDWLAVDFVDKITAATNSDTKPDFIWPSRTMVYEDKGTQMPKRASIPFTSDTVNSDEVLSGLFDATSSGMAFRRAAFLAVGGFDENLAVSEDRDLIFKLLTDGYSARPEQAAVMYFRIHGGPRLSRDEKKTIQAQADLTVLERHRAFLHKHPKLADRFIGRMAKRLWENGFLKEAIRANALQCGIAPGSIRGRKRQIGWNIMLPFKTAKILK